MLKQLEAKHTLLDSVEEMLSPASLSRLLQCSVSQVNCRPFESSNGFSANQLFHVSAGDQPLVMKRMRPSKDWLAIGSDDYRCRAVRVWQYGLLDRLQPYICHGIITACRDGDEYAILMQDVSPGLVGFGQEVTPQMIRTMLDRQAALHALFWEDESLAAPELGLSSLPARLSLTWPEKLHLYGHTPQTVDMIRQGWEALFEMVEPDVCEALQSIIANPQPLVDALANYPRTLIHGDYRLDNLALLPDSGQLVAFDWQNAAYVPATIDLCWFVMSGGVFHRQEEYVQHYQKRLFELLDGRFDQALWPAMLDLGCLFDVLTKGNWHALFAVIADDADYMRQSVDSYNNLVRQGIRWLQ